VKITMVARDFAPSRAFELVKKELLERNVAVVAHLESEKPLSGTFENIQNDIKTSNLVFTGMSCSEELAKEEIFAASEARAFDVPYGFYADLFGTSSREWFGNLRENAHFVFVLSEEEAHATRLIFPNAEVVVSGNPLLENAFSASRSSTDVRNSLGLKNGDFLLYCTAGKDREVNRIHFQGVIDAVSRLPNRHQWNVFFMLHPGDKNDPSVYADFTEVEGISASIVSPKEMKAKNLKAFDVVAACDLMVAAVSTSGIEAACRRKPVIDFLSPASVKRMKKQTGSDVWPPCKFGVSRAVMGDPAELCTAIQDLMSEDGFQAMRARQEECFPVPKMHGAAVGTITEKLLDL